MHPRVRSFYTLSSLNLLDEELIIVCEIVFFNDSKHAAGVTLGIAHARRSMASLRKCNELCMRSKHLFHISSHHVFSHAGNAGNECSSSRHERSCVRFQRSLVFAGKAFLACSTSLRSHIASPRSTKFYTVVLLACSWCHFSVLRVVFGSLHSCPTRSGVTR